MHYLIDLLVGERLGNMVGCFVGKSIGDKEGDRDGIIVGYCVGKNVTPFEQSVLIVILSIYHTSFESKSMVTL